MTYKEMDAATREAFERGSKTHPRPPCSFCGSNPREMMDHLCLRCRHNVNETRRLAGIDVEKESR